MVLSANQSTVNYVGLFDFPILPHAALATSSSYHFDVYLAEREREIEILTEAQRELKNNLRGLKADYVSADAADVIRSLRTTLRGVNRQVRKCDIG